MVRLADIPIPFNPDPIIRAEIQHFIYPFNPGMVTLWTSSVTELERPMIFVSSSTFTDDIYGFDGRELYSFASNDLREMASFIGVKAGQFFAGLTEPVPSNVVLGYN